MTALNRQSLAQRGGRRVALALALRRYPVAGSGFVALLAIALLYLGLWIARVLPGERWDGALARVPCLLLAAFLMRLTWSRFRGRRRPGTLWLAWPVLLSWIWMLTLVAWHADHDWLVILVEEGLVAFWEEAVFRGVIFVLLLRRSKRMALFGSAALFGVAHAGVLFQGNSVSVGIWGIVWPFGIGVLFAALRQRTGTIWCGVIAHWSFNVFDDLCPKPLGWSLANWNDITYELILLLAVFIAWGLAAYWRSSRSAAFSVVFAGCLIALAAFAGEPRAGWDGPAFEVRVTRMKVIPAIDWWHRHRYRLQFNKSQVTVVEFAIFGVDNRVRRLTASGGVKEWTGFERNGTLVWPGGVAPATIYQVESSSPTFGIVSFQLTYLDSFGWERVWSGELKGQD